MHFFISFLNIFTLIYFINNNYIITNSSISEVLKGNIDKINLSIFIFSSIGFLIYKLILFNFFKIKWNLSFFSEITSGKLTFWHIMIGLSGLLIDILIFSGLGLIGLKLFLVENQLTDNNYMKIGNGFLLIKVFSEHEKLVYINNIIKELSLLNKDLFESYNLSNFNLDNLTKIELAKDNIFLFQIKEILHNLYNHQIEVYKLEIKQANYYNDLYNRIYNNTINILNSRLFLFLLGTLAIGTISYKGVQKLTYNPSNGGDENKQELFNTSKEEIKEETNTVTLDTLRNAILLINNDNKINLKQLKNMSELAGVEYNKNGGYGENLNYYLKHLSLKIHEIVKKIDKLEKLNE